MTASRIIRKSSGTKNRREREENPAPISMQNTRNRTSIHQDHLADFRFQKVAVRNFATSAKKTKTMCKTIQNVDSCYGATGGG
eukprot:scaffold10429_cov126-Cylindrotheca_fusiformis.AAC.19